MNLNAAVIAPREWCSFLPPLSRRLDVYLRIHDNGGTLSRQLYSAPDSVSWGGSSFPLSEDYLMDGKVECVFAIPWLILSNLLARAEDVKELVSSVSSAFSHSIMYMHSHCFSQHSDLVFLVSPHAVVFQQTSGQTLYQLSYCYEC